MTMITTMEGKAGCSTAIPARLLWWIYLGMAAIVLCARVPVADGAVLFTNLLSFNSSTHIFPDELFFGRDGFLYLSMDDPAGGTNGYGGVLRVAPDGSSYTLVPFTAQNAYPSSLIQGLDGNFYGTSSRGGTNGGYGTVFELTTNGTITTLCSFGGTNGKFPGGLVQTADGNFYGTTLEGGIGFVTNYPVGNGTIFKLSTNGTLCTLVWFNGTNGANPEPLLLNGDGNLYGTTSAGGPDTNENAYKVPGAIGFGTAFVMTPNGDLSTLAFFNSTNGGGEISALIHGLDGNFYGTTSGGGTYRRGSVFQVTTNSTLTTIYSFDGTCGYPPTFFLQAQDGNFYGGTTTGYFVGNQFVGSPFYKLTPSGALTALLNFAQGDDPYAVIQGTDGCFYGTSLSGGANGDGYLFRISAPVAPVFQSITPTPGNINLTWSSVAGQTYQVQYSTDLSRSGWNNLGAALTATNGSGSISDVIGSDAQRFYRVIITP